MCNHYDTFKTKVSFLYKKESWETLLYEVSPNGQAFSNAFRTALPQMFWMSVCPLTERYAATPAALPSLPIAGPVIVYGTVASVVYGFIYWITTLF